MEITMENVRKLVRDHGQVSIVDSAGKVQLLRNESADVWAMVEQADTFLFAGSRYSRGEFERVLDRMIATPGHAAQISLPEPPPAPKPRS